jgi:hypothetical protein
VSAGVEISMVNAEYTPHELDTLFEIAPPAWFWPDSAILTLRRNPQRTPMLC